MRINARLGRQEEKKFQYIMDQTHETATNVLREAIDLYYARVKDEHSSRSKVLFKHGFVGSAEGTKSLSVDYKKHLKKSLGQKWSS